MNNTKSIAEARMGMGTATLLALSFAGLVAFTGDAETESPPQKATFAKECAENCTETSGIFAKAAEGILLLGIGVASIGVCVGVWRAAGEKDRRDKIERPFERRP